MRRSVDNMDGTIWDVWLDGVLQKNVVMADDETGEVERFKLDEHGAFCIAGDALETETVCGKVEIRPAGARITKLQGLVAPVWSDAGEVPDITFEVCSYSTGDLKPIPEGQRVTRIWWGAELVADYRQANKESDPNAKPALPALTRVSGNKRGPGWCEE